MSDPARPAQQHVYTGTWINWSRGPVMGATLTLSQRTGSLLIAFVALFVSFAGTRFFRITCYSFHRLFSTQSPQDGVHHQRQAILRNSNNATSDMWALCRVLWKWRHHRMGSFLRIFPIVIYTCISIFAFAFADILSLNIAAMSGDEVILNYQICGWNEYRDNVTSTEIVTTLRPYDHSRLNSFTNYAQNCYAKNTKSGGCTSFVKAGLPSRVDLHASFLFSKEICRSTNRNIKIDTGYLDSYNDLGLNAPKDKRVLLRQVFHCAPVVTDGYTKTVLRENNTFVEYYYGEEIKGLVPSNAFTYSQTPFWSMLTGSSNSSFVGRLWAQYDLK